MEEPRPEKVAVVDEVRERFAAASAAILTEYRGLHVQEMQTLRRALTAAGGEYKVYKNTLVRRAARESGLAELEPLLEGPTGIAFVRDDVSAVAKVLRDFSRATPALVVKGGLVGRSLFDAKGAARLADLPSREALLSQFAGALAAPLQKLAALMKALPQNLAYGLNALIEARGGPPAVDTEAAPAVETEAAPEPSASSADETASAADGSVASNAPEVAAPASDEGVAPAAPEAGTADESDATDALAAAAAEAEAAMTARPAASEEAAAGEAADVDGTTASDDAGPEAVS